MDSQINKNYNPSSATKQRTSTSDEGGSATTTTTTTTRNNKPAAVGSSIMSGRKEKRMAMARRGLPSLAIAVGLPLSLTFLSTYFLRPGGYGVAAGQQAWFPPLWVVHVTYLATAFLMGLSGWLVWAEGGFHKQPAVFYVYGAQLGLSVLWGPVVFGLGSPSLGLIVCLGGLGALAGCSRQFKHINPFAADLVKPCFAWAAFLFILNLKLLSIM